MFTGTIEKTARVISLVRRGPGAILAVENPCKDSDPAGYAKPGESISVNGACLTVVSANASGISFDISPETLEKTTFPAMSAGKRVNLERALRVGQDISGHFVTGHVDGRGRVARFEKSDAFAQLAVAFPKDLDAFIVPKGSIAVNGASLTVASINPDSFSVALIPETLSRTALEDLTVGEEVNIETDMLGKYVIRWLSTAVRPDSAGLTLDRLRDAGL